MSTYLYLPELEAKAHLQCHRNPVHTHLNLAGYVLISTHFGSLMAPPGGLVRAKHSLRNGQFVKNTAETRQLTLPEGNALLHEPGQLPPLSSVLPVH